MKASAQDVYGLPEVLSLREIDRPEAGDGDVLIRVRAAGLDQGVWHLMAGTPGSCSSAACSSSGRWR